MSVADRPAGLTDYLPSARQLDEAETRLDYHDDPVGYIERRIGGALTVKQKEVARSVVEHPRTIVLASHSVGKTRLGGGLVNWWYETRVPGICLTTAPGAAQVKDLLWKEVRAQAPPGVKPYLMPAEPRISDRGRAPYRQHHYAVGYTARDANAFQGRHEEELFVIFDEATGVDRIFWEAAEGMLTGPATRWLCILNPTDTTSTAYEMATSGDWNVIRISALDHPNITAELRGERAPFPKAIRLATIERWLQAWCTPSEAGAVDPSIFEFPPGSGVWYQPGPLFEGRVLGRWPSQAIDSVWSDTLLDSAFRVNRPPLPVPDAPPEIGCDVARYGDDFTSMVVRRGAVALHHETHNGWSTTRTAARLKELADEWAAAAGLDAGRDLLVKVDDDGVGGGVVDQCGAYTFVPASGAEKAYEEEYPNRRSEVWFAVAAMAYRGELDLSRLSGESQRLIRAQLMQPKWTPDAAGRRVVERKEITKKRLKRSPDDADALNLCFAAAKRAPHLLTGQAGGLLARSAPAGWQGQKVMDRRARR